MLTWIVIIAWVSPIVYLFFVLSGEIALYIRKKKYYINPGFRDEELLIYQIPTVGNFETVNKIFKLTKEYNLPIKIEYWVVVEANDPHKEDYNCDRLIVVPEDFCCGTLYKARALEYARRVRIDMVNKNELTDNYMLIQSDDDSLPSKPFILEALKVDADVILGNISPRPIGFWNTVLDYERCIGCVFFCNIFTNTSKPVWGHGEGVVFSSKVDRNITYDIIGDHVTASQFLAEDMLHLHRSAVEYPKMFNSKKPIYITPPQGIEDAIKQRRRWTWGHIAILRQNELPTANRIRILAADFFGIWIFLAAMLGVPLFHLGLLSVPGYIYPLLLANLIIWLGLRGYSVWQLMGWKHAILAILTSYITVTLNFFVHIVGLLQGEPNNFVVIRKTL